MVILDAYPAIAPGLLAAVRSGKLDGGTYQVREEGCGCVLAWTKHLTGYTGYAWDLTGDLGLPVFFGFAAIEHILLGTRAGDTTERPPLAALEQWIMAWMAAHPS